MNQASTDSIRITAPNGVVCEVPNTTLAAELVRSLGNMTAPSAPPPVANEPRRARKAKPSVGEPAERRGGRQPGPAAQAVMAALEAGREPDAAKIAEKHDSTVASVQQMIRKYRAAKG